MIEIELRFAIESVPVALTELTPTKEKSQIDIYYDTPDYALLRRGAFLRIRNGSRVDFKADLSCGEVQHDYCNEMNFDLATISQKSDEINKLLNVLGIHAAGKYNDFDDYVKQNELQVLAMIDKNRREYKITNNLTIALDDAKNMGLFIEAEITVPDNTEKEEIQKYIAEMRGVLSERGILQSDVEPINVGYVELYLMQHNRKAYDLGLYKE